MKQIVCYQCYIVMKLVYFIEKTLFVNEEAIMFEFNGMEDGEWLIETQSNRILFLSFSDVESSKHLKYSLKVGHLFYNFCFQKLFSNTLLLDIMYYAYLM